MPFDITNIYTSFTENLIMAAIELDKNHHGLQAPNLILYHEVSLWTNKDIPNFSIAVGAFDSVEACELVEAQIYIR